MTMMWFSSFGQLIYTLERCNERVIHKVSGTSRAVWGEESRSDIWLQETEGMKCLKGE